MADNAPWRIAITSRAERELTTLPVRDQARVRAGIDDLGVFPTRGDLQKLRGLEDEWRLRIGRWRIRLRPDRDNHVIVVLRVLPRGRAYRP